MLAVRRALIWAVAMILFALLGRYGLADRHAVQTILLVMPLIAFFAIRGELCCHVVRKA